jgi:glycine/sarcosine N-methyltransferase
MEVKDCYDELASHYHLLFENWESSIARQAAVLSEILERECGAPGKTRILDIACGIGTQALGLAKLGFQVTGCDISAAAVERAQREAKQRNLDIPFSVANMLDLSAFPESSFDAVICMDNALPHLENSEQLIQAAKQCRAKLRPGGLFMASIRDYDRLLEKMPAVQGPSFFPDQEQRRIVLQVWDWLDERRYIFHLYITRMVAGEWQTFHTTAVYRAVMRDEMWRALTDAGFSDVQWLYPEESGFYQPIVVARAE